MRTTPLKIGELTLPHRLIQGPLAGISCAAFRGLFTDFMQPAYAVTEMISAHSMLQHHRLNPRYLAKSPQENRWCIQLSGNDPMLLAEATQIATSYEPDLIDLNCGCPKPKIRSKGSGSALTDDLPQLQKVIHAMRQATTLPLTVKIRVSGQSNLPTNYLQAVKVIEQEGADAIIVHGRHHSEGYDVKASYQQIANVVETVNIPVIANGDILNRESLLHCLKTTQAAGFMIARGGIGHPWIFQEMLQPNFIHSKEQSLLYFKKHLIALAALEGCETTALLQGRRLLKWYFPELSAAQLANCYKILKLFQLCDKLADLILLKSNKE